MPITINDVARKAGVSPATVSRVINKGPHVSDKVKYKVENAVKELNYVPSAYARGLSRNQSNIVGVIIPEITNPFFSEIIEGITQIGDQHDLNILFFNTDEDVRKEERALHILQEYRIRGLIITPVTDIGHSASAKEYARRFEELNIPIVLVDRSIQGTQFDGIYFDDYSAIYNATSLLLENNHKDIVLFEGNPNHIVSQKRTQGYMDAFKHQGREFLKKNMIPCDFSLESSYEITKSMILSHNLPTAFIGITNMLSMGCLKALYEYNISIPEEIAFIGYDRITLYEVLNLNLTLAEKNAREMGERAAKLMIDKLAGIPTPHTTILNPAFSIRGSERYPTKDPNLRVY